MGQIWGSEKIMGQNMGQGSHLRRIFDALFCNALLFDALFCDALFWLEKMYPFSNVVVNHIVFFRKTTIHYIQ